MKVEEIRRRLELIKGSPKRSLGQNFLVSESVIDKIIEATQKTNPSCLIEIGPGLGSLTDHLIRLGLPLTLIELDQAIVEYWRGLGQEVIEADALKVNWGSFNRDVLVSNLPYQISSSLVIQQSVSETSFRQMILMFQKEVAQRIRSEYRLDSYGMLSVIAQCFWDISKVTDASPRDFYPAPKIASRVLQFQAKPSPVEDKEHFLSFVKAAFEQRRKKLFKSMGTFLNNKKIELEEFQALCHKMGFTDNVRAQEIKPGQYIELYHAYLALKRD